VARQVKVDRKATTDEVVIAKAVVAVDAHGKSHVHEAGHGRWGAGIGAATGGLLSLMGGPAGLLVWAAAGAVIGGVAGQHVGQTIPESDLKALGEQLPPNSSALLVLIEDKYAEAVIDDMKGYSAKVITLTVGDQASGEIATVVTGEVTGPDAGKGEATPTDAGKGAAMPEASQGTADTKA